MSWLVETLEIHRQEIAEVLGRTLRLPGAVEFALCYGQELKLALTRPGILIRLRSKVGEIDLLVPEGKLLPADYRNPSPTSRAIMDTLAQELAVILFPEDFEATASCEICPELWAAAGIGSESPHGVHVRYVAGEGEIVAALVALGREPELRKNFVPEDPEGQGKALSAPVGSAEKEFEGLGGATRAPEASDWNPAAGSRAKRKDVSAYLRTLLRVPLRASVTLARRKQPVANILQLSPGTIIQFEKSCEELLDLEIAGRIIAQGEAVKVGEKFGLRVLRILPPPEQVQVLKPQQHRASQDCPVSKICGEQRPGRTVAEKLGF